MQPTDPAVMAFLDAVDPPRRDEARALHALFAEATGFPARVWPGGILGYGRYAYRYESGHDGVSLATGFAPRKSEISIYIMPGYTAYGAIVATLGRHRLGKSCLYLKRLADADGEALAALIRAGLRDLARLWPVEPG
jgi:hypothetical protein